MIITLRNMGVRAITPYLGLLAVTVFSAVISGGRTLSLVNLGNIFNQSVLVILSGLGVIFVMSQGSLDLTQGGLIGLSPLVGFLASTYLHPWLFVPVTIITGAALGMISGVLFADLRVPSFVLTLSLSFILRNVIRSLFVFVPNGGMVFIPPVYFALDSLTVKIPTLTVMVAVATYLFRYSPAGYYCRAIGSNEIVALYSGINVKLWKRMAFLFAGLAAGIASVFSTVRIGTITMTSGSFFEFDVLIAILLGGTPLTGGSNSRIGSVIIGAFTIAVLNNGLALGGVPAVYRALIKGLLFIGVVAVSFEREKVGAVK